MNKTETEQRFVNDFYNLSKAELMKKYDIGEHIYEDWRRRNNLNKAPNRKKRQPFTNQENLFIKNNYMTMTDKKIAKVLGRSENAISIRRIRMNLHKDSRKHEDTILSDREYNMIIWWLTGDSFDTIRQLYKCSNEDIENALKQTNKMKLAIARIKKYGCYPIVRKRHEILKYNKDWK
jgi:transposase